MQLFLDTTDLEVLERLAASGMVDGVTTNPSLIAKSGRNMAEVIKGICAIVEGPVSAEVAAIDADAMVAEGEHLAKLADNVVVKVPLTWEGLAATRRLAQGGILVNVTLCFSSAQALLAAKAGATFISPFIGRLEDKGEDGMQLIEDIRLLYDTYEYDIELLAASIRTPRHVELAALAGADAATIPPAVFEALIKHPLTDAGLEQFMADWAGTGQSIL